jgi:nitrogen fixation protein NifU and related proteins
MDVLRQNHFACRRLLGHCDDAKTSDCSVHLECSEMYSPQVLDHFQNPRNPGTVEHPDAMVQTENPACGDILQLTAKAVDGRIAEICFLAKGCVPAMACGSALTELVHGKTLEEARKLRREELVQKLGGLPEASAHASHLALDALDALLRKL